MRHPLKDGEVAGDGRCDRESCHLSKKRMCDFDNYGCRCDWRTVQRRRRTNRSVVAVGRMVGGVKLESCISRFLPALIMVIHIVRRENVARESLAQRTCTYTCGQQALSKTLDRIWSGKAFVWLLGSFRVGCVSLVLGLLVSGKITIWAGQD